MQTDTLMRAHGNWEMLTGDILRNSAQRSPEHTALIDNGRRISYSDFDADSNRLAHGLLGFRLAKGAKVGIMSANRAEYAIAYFGIARTGYVSAHVSARSTAEDLAYVLHKVGAEVLLFESQFMRPGRGFRVLLI